jgi:hypothetical protein
MDAALRRAGLFRHHRRYKKIFPSPAMVKGDLNVPATAAKAGWNLDQLRRGRATA